MSTIIDEIRKAEKTENPEIEKPENPETPKTPTPAALTLRAKYIKNRSKDSKIVQSLLYIKPVIDYLTGSSIYEPVTNSNGETVIKITDEEQFDNRFINKPLPNASDLKNEIIDKVKLSTTKNKFNDFDRRQLLLDFNPEFQKFFKYPDDKIKKDSQAFVLEINGSKIKPIRIPDNIYKESSPDVDEIKVVTKRPVKTEPAEAEPVLTPGEAVALEPVVPAASMPLALEPVALEPVTNAIVELKKDVIDVMKAKNEFEKSYLNDKTVKDYIEGTNILSFNELVDHIDKLTKGDDYMIASAVSNIINKRDMIEKAKQAASKQKLASYSNKKIKNLRVVVERDNNISPMLARDVMKNDKK